MALGLPAQGHVVVDHAMLRDFVQNSRAALWVEFVSSVSMWTAPDVGDRQEFFRVRTLEVIAGEPVPDEFDFFPHTEGLPRFHRGDHALLFLEETGRRDEFAGLAKRFAYFSVQGPGREWRLRKGEEAVVLDVARAYAALHDPAGTSSAARLRAIWLRELDSRVAALQDDAIADLVRASSARGLWTSPVDVEAFAARIHSPALSLSQRLVLLRLLEGRPGFDATSHWSQILSEAHSSDEVALLIQLTAGVDDGALTTWIGAQLASPDRAVRLAAARALRHPWHAAQVPHLAAVLGDPDARVARAAVQSLGAIATQQARVALRAFAGEAPAARRRWAEAELRRMGE